MIKSTRKQTEKGFPLTTNISLLTVIFFIMLGNIDGMITQLFKHELSHCQISQNKKQNNMTVSGDKRIYHNLYLLAKKQNLYMLSSPSLLIRKRCMTIEFHTTNLMIGTLDKK